MKLSENIHVQNKAKAHHVPKDTISGLDQYTALSQTARRKGGVKRWTTLCQYLVPLGLARCVRFKGLRRRGQFAKNSRLEAKLVETLHIQTLYYHQDAVYT